MPVMGGTEATSLIREIERERRESKSTIVALTANVREVPSSDLFCEMLSKPLSRERLRRMLLWVYRKRRDRLTSCTSGEVPSISS